VPACDVDALKLSDLSAMQKASRGRESLLLSFLRRSPSPRLVTLILIFVTQFAHFCLHPQNERSFFATTITTLFILRF